MRFEISFHWVLLMVLFPLQNMYEGGDEEMKKTIAKAWTDARSGKAGDSLKGL